MMARLHSFLKALFQVFISSLAVRWRTFSAFRGHPHSLAYGSLFNLQMHSGKLNLPKLWNSVSSPVLVFLLPTLLCSSSTFMSPWYYLYWIHPNNPGKSCFKVTLILSAKLILSFKITYLQVWGVSVWKWGVGRTLFCLPKKVSWNHYDVLRMYLLEEGKCVFSSLSFNKQIDQVAYFYSSSII